MVHPWIFITEKESYYWNYQDGVYGDMGAYFVNPQRAISYLVVKLAVL